MNRPVVAWVVGIVVALAIMFGPTLIMGTEMPPKPIRITK